MSVDTVQSFLFVWQIILKTAYMFYWISTQSLPHTLHLKKCKFWHEICTFLTLLVWHSDFQNTLVERWHLPNWLPSCNTRIKFTGQRCKEVRAVIYDGILKTFATSTSHMDTCAYVSCAHQSSGWVRHINAAWSGDRKACRITVVDTARD